MSIKIEGFIEIIKPVQNIGETFRKREFVIRTDEEKYPQLIQLEFIQAKCELLDQFSVGEFVAVDVDIKGRKWISPQGDEKYFNTLNAWQIEKFNVEAGQSAQDKLQNDLVKKSEDADDDLPF